jgi:formamidopyrimidine-DNA glycosylase
MRRGKSMWCETAGSGSAVTLGLHLGMSGKIVVADPDGAEVDGGDYWERGRMPGDYSWARFTLTFQDGGRLILVDPRRLGRVTLDPQVQRLGPDAELMTPAQFRAAFAAGGAAPIKARLMDQHRIAGIGNLLADEALWRARGCTRPCRSASCQLPRAPDSCERSVMPSPPPSATAVSTR